MDKHSLLDQITKYYLSSHDYNGIPVDNLSPFNEPDLEELIRDEKVFILSEDRTINIFINLLNQHGSKEEQLQAIHSHKRFAIYPTSVYLKTIDNAEDKPFSKMLAQGAEQLRVLYFCVDILDLYAGNPQYTFQDYGYRGSVYPSSSTSEDDPIHSEYIKDFGIAYPSTEPRDSDRAIGVFLRDLSKLNREAQYKWRGFLLPSQTAFVINGGFLKNLIYGKWVSDYWIFDALLKEIAFINELCKNIGLPSMFRNEYSRESHELIGYRLILIPSKKNYFDFVSALEKIVVNNLNYDTFQKPAAYIQPVARKKENGDSKGSVEMLEEWVSKNYYTACSEALESFKKYVSGTFRKVRKIRQIPAHELYSNEHDKSLYRQQNALIIEVYNAVESLRLMLNTHPLNKEIKVPTILSDSEHIVIY